MSESAHFSLEGPYKLSKHGPPTMSVNYIAENHPDDDGDTAPLGTTVRLNKNRVAVKVQSAGGSLSPSVTVTVNDTVALSAGTGGSISMNATTCSVGRRLWVRTKTDLV